LLHPTIIIIATYFKSSNLPRRFRFK
jgi:hypothetical protein